MKKFIVLSAVILGLGACTTAEKDETTDTGNQATQSDSAAKNTDAKADGSSGQAMGSKSSCTLDKDTRVIEVKKTEAGGCELFYTKFGEAKSVASSGFGTQYCEEVKDRIQTNLNKAGFTCQ